MDMNVYNIKAAVMPVFPSCRTFPLFLCALLLPLYAAAQPAYPVKPIRIVLGSTPGASPDILARMITTKMSENWQQTVVIDNKVGAGGLIAANLVAKATPDGYTLLATSPAIAIRAALASNPDDVLKDFSAVTEIGFSNTALLAGPASGAKSIREIIAFANANPGKVFFASGGALTADHINGERFRIAAGIKVQHVAFKGQSEALIEVVAGRMLYTSASLTSSMPFIKNGTLRVLAVAQRTPLLPDVPSMEESLKGWGRNGSQALLAPKGTPLAIRQKISREVARITSLPEIKEKLDAVSFGITANSPEQHEKNLRADVAAFSRVLKESGLKTN
jgi:tripartite-type tricarboxylate transporter receptor subunit TctC